LLEAASFDVQGEVKGCDIVAVRAGEGLTLTIVEMKLGFTLDLLLQVTDRMRVAAEVWLAVPATTTERLGPAGRWRCGMIYKAGRLVRAHAARRVGG
jgi:hypothetical protein